MWNGLHEYKIKDGNSRKAPSAHCAIEQKPKTRSQAPLLLVEDPGNLFSHATKSRLHNQGYFSRIKKIETFSLEDEILFPRILTENTHLSEIVIVLFFHHKSFHAYFY